MVLVVKTERTVGRPFLSVKTQLNDWIHQEHRIRRWCVGQPVRQSPNLLFGADHGKEKCVVSGARARAKTIEGLLTRHKPYVDSCMVWGSVRFLHLDVAKGRGGILPSSALPLLRFGETDV